MKRAKYGGSSLTWEPKPRTWWDKNISYQVIFQVNREGFTVTTGSSIIDYASLRILFAFTNLIKTLSNCNTSINGVHSWWRRRAGWRLADISFSAVKWLVSSDTNPVSVIPLSHLHFPDTPQSEVQSLSAAICRNDSKLLLVQVILATNCCKILCCAGPENDNSSSEH